MRLEISPESGQLSIPYTTSPGLTNNDLSAWVSFRKPADRNLYKINFSDQNCSAQVEPFADVHGAGVQHTLCTPAAADGVILTYNIKNYDQQQFILVQLCVQNQSPGPIYLHEFCLADSDLWRSDQNLLGSLEAGLRFFEVGWHGWDFTGTRIPGNQNSASWVERLTNTSYSNPSTPKPKRQGELWSEGWGILASPTACLVAGLVSTAHQFGQVYACTRPGEAAFKLMTQLDGVRLDPGERRESEWGYLKLVPMPSAQPMADFVEAVGREMKARIPSTPPPMWTHWYHFFHDISEQKLLETIDLLAERSGELPIKLIELDDGYQSAWGDWTITNEKFPHGLGWLAERIKARGFVPGIWLAPFVVHSKSQIARQHPDWLVKNARGKPAFAGFVYNLILHALDLTQPEVLEYLQRLASTLTQEWGYEMLKIDFINSAALPGQRANPKLTRAEALRAGLEAIRHGAGDGTFLLGCGCPFGPAIGIVDAMRIGPDTTPSWEPYFNWLTWAGPLVKNNPCMPSLRNALRNTINLSSLHQHWWWNDPDCLLVRGSDTRLTEAEVQSAITLVGMSGGLLVMSDDMGKVSPERLQWVSKLVPNLGLRGQPLDIFEGEMPGIYLVKMENGGQAWQLVALFNWTDHPADCILRFSDHWYKAGTRLHLFDFWSTKHVCTEAETMIYRAIPAHGCKLVRVCEEVSGTQIVGDTLHISQGREISSMRIVDECLVIETINMGRKINGQLWLKIDESISSAMINGQSMGLETRAEGLYKITIEER
jgi:alpha-galactosidase